MKQILALQKLAPPSQDLTAVEWSTFSNCCHGSNISNSACC